MENREFDYRYIRYVRLLRGLTLEEMGRNMQVDKSTLAKLEKNQLDFSPLYESRFIEALKKLNVSKIELASIEIMVEMAANNENKGGF